MQLKKDGLTGDLATPAQLAALERFVTGQVAAMIDEILSGKTQPNPVDRGPGGFRLPLVRLFFRLS